MSRAINIHMWGCDLGPAWTLCRTDHPARKHVPSWLSALHRLVTTTTLETFAGGIWVVPAVSPSFLPETWTILVKLYVVSAFCAASITVPEACPEELGCTDHLARKPAACTCIPFVGRRCCTVRHACTEKTCAMTTCVSHTDHPSRSRVSVNSHRCCTGRSPCQKNVSDDLDRTDLPCARYLRLLLRSLCCAPAAMRETCATTWGHIDHPARDV